MVSVDKREEAKHFSSIDSRALVSSIGGADGSPLGRQPSHSFGGCPYLGAGVLGTEIRSYVGLHLIDQRELLPSLVYPDKPNFFFGPCHSATLYLNEVQKFLDKEMDRFF